MRDTRVPVVVGVADHYGAATLVTAAADRGEPIVVDRRRVRLIEDGLPSSPYHHDTLALPNGESERLIRKVKHSVAAATEAAFDHLSSDLAPRYRVTAIAIRQPPLDRLPATVKEVHRSYHVQCRADGMLYHVAICDAARQRGWDVAFHRRGDELSLAAHALGADVDEVERFISGMAPALKAPWTAEHRHVFAAAIARLNGSTRLPARRGAT